MNIDIEWGIESTLASSRTPDTLLVKIATMYRRALNTEPVPRQMPPDHHIYAAAPAAALRLLRPEKSRMIRGSPVPEGCAGCRRPPPSGTCIAHACHGTSSSFACNQSIERFQDGFVGLPRGYLEVVQVAGALRQAALVHLVHATAPAAALHVFKASEVPKDNYGSFAPGGCAG